MLDNPNDSSNQKQPHNMDMYMKIATAAISVGGLLFGVYTSFISNIRTAEQNLIQRIEVIEKNSATSDDIKQLAQKIEDLEKQSIRDDKYREMTKENDEEIKEEKRELISVNESLMELFRMIRHNR